MVWLPAIAAAGMAVYTAEEFPAWRGNVFVGFAAEGRDTGHGAPAAHRVQASSTRSCGREAILQELRQRIREVRQGPDGLLYLLTDEDDGALLRIEPAP